MTADARLAGRLTSTRALWGQLHVWLEVERGRVLDSSATAKALDYSLNHWPRSRTTCSMASERGRQHRESRPAMGNGTPRMAVRGHPVDTVVSAFNSKVIFVAAAFECLLGAFHDFQHGTRHFQPIEPTLGQRLATPAPSFQRIDELCISVHR